MELDKHTLQAYFDNALPDDQARQIRESFVFDADFRSQWRELAPEVSRKVMTPMFVQRVEVDYDQASICAERCTAGANELDASFDYLSYMNRVCDAYEEIIDETAAFLRSRGTDPKLPSFSEEVFETARLRNHEHRQQIIEQLSELRAKTDRGGSNTQQEDTSD